MKRRALWHEEKLLWNFIFYNRMENAPQLQNHIEEVRKGTKPSSIYERKLQVKCTTFLELILN